VSAPSQRFGPIVAAVVALGLGALAALMLVAGHHPWDGGVVFVVSSTHGVHRGDILAVFPMVVGIGLADWCRRQG
jgi:hypothetical protein